MNEERGKDKCSDEVVKQRRRSSFSESMSNELSNPTCNVHYESGTQIVGPLSKGICG